MCSMHIILPCTICEKTFNRQSNLNCHYKYVHDIADNVLHMDDGIEIKYHNCEECSFTSRYEKYLRRHILTQHADHKEFNSLTFIVIEFTSTHQEYT